ncbi:hypothetical protein DESC_740199 [Desulfosarcina cetonica]|nr:hypothetical protein DESC_740199 [Desulfosarcina cetonica]
MNTVLKPRQADRWTGTRDTGGWVERLWETSVQAPLMGNAQFIESFPGQVKVDECAKRRLFLFPCNSRGSNVF